MTDSRHPKTPRERANERVVSAPIRRKGVVTIPASIREQLGLEEGDSVIFSVRDGNVVITPARVIPRDQEWFWTPEWQAKEAEADADYAAGRFRTFHSDEEFLASIEEALEDD